MLAIPLLFSDLEYGTKQYGMIKRVLGTDPEVEDFKYLKHVKAVTGDNGWRVFDGTLFR